MKDSVPSTPLSQMSEEVNELIDSFLALCLEQRQIISNSSTKSEDDETISQKRRELKTASLELANKLYTKAAELERSGDISKAMELYNRAYKMDPEIDRHIDHERLAAEISKKDLSEIEPYYNPFRKLAIQNDPIDRDLILKLSNSESDLNLDSKSNSDLKGKKGEFRITFKDQPSLLKDLPENVLSRVFELLGWMHIPSLEALSMTSRYLYLACRQDSLWKDLCKHMECRNGDTRLSSNFDCWRLQYIMRPSFRSDGIYISKITYFRQGYQESAISQPSHLVTYYRYLRFFNGPASKRLVLALVSTEKPKQVIDQLKEVDMKIIKAVNERIFSKNQKANFKRKAFDKRTIESSLNSTKANMFVGTFWRNNSPKTDRSFTVLLFDAHSKNPMRLKMTMELADPLKGAPAYRTAKCTEYRGLVEGDVGAESVEFSVNNWGKFYFSRVKSYT